jgi:glycosyltransferase involved in cell wall biosynthesis
MEEERDIVGTVVPTSLTLSQGDVTRNTKARPLLDLVVPALNEEARIGGTISAISDVVAARQLPVRIIVVDNGCVDTTASVADSCSRRTGVPIEVISCQTRGKGAAVRAGVLHGTAPYVGYCDADLPVPAEAIEWAVDLLDSGWEVVIGSRRCAGAQYVVRQPRVRRIGSAVFRAMSGGARGRVSDTQCGFKFFTRSVAQRVFRESCLNGFAFDVEVVARTLHLKPRLIEMPVPWEDRDGSSFRPLGDGTRSMLDLYSVRRRVRRWMLLEGSA